MDIIQFPCTKRGNQYAIVFMDYLTKWLEVFPAFDQPSVTVAKLLVEEIVSRHGVPSDILSDRGKAFLSGLMKEVELLLGFHKVNTTAYHPQTDGLVERFNRTLITMLAKTVEKGGPDWDERIPYVLLAYRASKQASTGESPFFKVYGRDPRLPLPATMTPKKTRTTADLKEYRLSLHQKMAEAWELARHSISLAQQRQKNAHDLRAKTPSFQEGERAFLYKPAERTGATRKLVRPFHDPYQVVEVGANTAKIWRVDRPEEEPILVAIDRLHRCPEELGNDFWPPDRTKRKTKVTSTASAGGKSGASTHLDGKVAVPAEKGAMSENQQTSVGGTGSGRVGSSEVGDGWRGDQEYGVDQLGWSGSDEMNGDRTSPGDDVVRGEDPLTSSDQYAGLEEVDADVQDQDWRNEEGEEMASVPAGTPECMSSTVRAAS